MNNKDMPVKAVKLIVSGVVQGVGFRYFVMTKAKELGLLGWTRNLPDGSVEVVAEGDKSLLESLIKELKIGPSHAHVTNLSIEPIEPTGEFSQFEIKGW